MRLGASGDTMGVRALITGDSSLVLVPVLLPFSVKGAEGADKRHVCSRDPLGWELYTQHLGRTSPEIQKGAFTIYTVQLFISALHLCLQSQPNTDSTLELLETSFTPNNSKSLIHFFTSFVHVLLKGNVWNPIFRL